MDRNPSPHDGGTSTQFVPMKPPDVPTSNVADGAGSMSAPADSSSADHSPPTTEYGRRRYLELHLEALRDAIIYYAKYADGVAVTVEASGKSIKSLPRGTHLPFVRSVRQYAKLNEVIATCDDDPEFLMQGDIMLWRDDYKDIDAQDMLDAVSTIWDPKKYKKWPTLASSLWSLSKTRDMVKPNRKRQKMN